MSSLFNLPPEIWDDLVLPHLQGRDVFNLNLVSKTANRTTKTRLREISLCMIQIKNQYQAVLKKENEVLKKQIHLHGLENELMCVVCHYPLNFGGPVDAYEPPDPIPGCAWHGGNHPDWEDLYSDSDEDVGTAYAKMLMATAVRNVDRIDVDSP